jgi:hypothetical protein
MDRPFLSYDWCRLHCVPAGGSGETLLATAALVVYFSSSVLTIGYHAGAQALPLGRRSFGTVKT